MFFNQYTDMYHSVTFQYHSTQWSKLKFINHVLNLLCKTQLIQLYRNYVSFPEKDILLSSCLVYYHMEICILLLQLNWTIFEGTIVFFWCWIYYRVTFNSSNICTHSNKLFPWYLLITLYWFSKIIL